MSVILNTDLPGLELYARGKVRDVYSIGDHLLFVATDRISAFDYILPTGIPDKGKVLTQLSVFWFEFLKDIVPSDADFLTSDPDARIEEMKKVVFSTKTAAKPLPVYVIEGRAEQGGVRPVSSN